MEAKKVNKHGHDPVGKEDADIDNDGDVDKSDSYLHNRRKAIKASMKKEEVEAPAAKVSGLDIARNVLNKMRNEEVEELDEVADEIAAIRKTLQSRRNRIYTPNHPEKKDSDKLRSKLQRLTKKQAAMKEEVEELDELSVDKLKAYRAKARADAYDADDVDDERRYRKRAAGSNMAGKKIVRQGGSLKTEEVELDEALDAAARYGQHHTAVKELMKSISQHIENHKSDALKHRDYRGKKGVNWGHVGDIAHIHSQLADIHDRLAQQGEYKKEMAESVEDDSDVEFTAEELAFLEDCGIDLEEARRGRPPKNAAAAQDEEPAALGYQLRKAASINKPVHFMNGEKKEVAQGHINAFNDHMAARKTAADKAAFQKRAHKSHAEFVKAVSEKVPSSSKDTGEIVKYR